MWRVVTLLRPLGWLGFLLVLTGAEAIQIVARRGDWGVVAIGAILLGVGAIVMLRGRRTPED